MIFQSPSEHSSLYYSESVLMKIDPFCLSEPVDSEVQDDDHLIFSDDDDAVVFLTS